MDELQHMGMKLIKQARKKLEIFSFNLQIIVYDLNSFHFVSTIHVKIITCLIMIIAMKVASFSFVLLLFSIGLASQAFAHTTVEVEPYEIEVGWGTEPPVVGFRNDFVFEISEPGDNPGVKVGITNAFKNLETTAKFGGVTKVLDISSDPRPGHYFSHVIPTKTGSYSIQLKGEINGVTVDVEIPLEDVESTAVLDFPPTSGSSSDQDVSALKSAVSSLQKDVFAIKSDSGEEASSEGAAYDFAILGLSIAAAAIILAVIALVKRK
jgi:hypothetical protein